MNRWLVNKNTRDRGTRIKRTSRQGYRGQREKMTSRQGYKGHGDKEKRGLVDKDTRDKGIYRKDD